MRLRHGATRDRTQVERPPRHRLNEEQSGHQSNDESGHHHLAVKKKEKNNVETPDRELFFDEDDHIQNNRNNQQPFPPGFPVNACLRESTGSHFKNPQIHTHAYTFLFSKHLPLYNPLPSPTHQKISIANTQKPPIPSVHHPTSGINHVAADIHARKRLIFCWVL